MISKDEVKPIKRFLPTNHTGIQCLIFQDQAMWTAHPLTFCRIYRVSIVQEQFIRLLQHAGMPKEDCDYFQGNGQVFGELLKEAHPRSTLFTGSQRVAEKLSVDLAGKVRISSTL